MAKKVVALLGSKRKANTYALLLQIQALLQEKDIQLEILELYKFEIKDCIGCDQCILKGHCVLKDDTAWLMDTLAAADGIILASPVYLQQVSGKMKTFFDRTCSWYHRPVLTEKPILCVASTKGSGLKATLAYLNNVATQWGGVPAGTLGRTIFQAKNPVSTKEIQAFIQYLEQPETFAPTFSQLMAFEVQKALAKYLNQLDAAYWQARGWLDQPYFYPCKINRVKSGITGAFGNFLYNKMAKNPPVEDPAQNG